MSNGKTRIVHSPIKSDESFSLTLHERFLIVDALQSKADEHIVVAGIASLKTGVLIHHTALAREHIELALTFAHGEEECGPLAARLTLIDSFAKKD